MVIKAATGYQREGTQPWEWEARKQVKVILHRNTQDRVLNLTGIAITITGEIWQ
jgi:hypothetical protein